MSMIFGEGYLRVAYDGDAIDLVYSYGDLSWEDEMEEIRVLSGELVRFYDGSRAKIKCVINNVFGECAAILELMDMLNRARRLGAGVMVYPRYNGYGSRGYLCHVPTEFNPERLGQVATGQKINVAFTSIQRYDKWAVYDETTMQIFPWMDHLGNAMKDHLGNALEFRK